MSSSLSFIPQQSSTDIEEEKLITDEVVFKCAMTRDYRKLEELALIQEGITRLDTGNMLLRQFVNLKKLDLSFNKLAKIENLDVIKDLRELNLSFNRLEAIEHLHKLPSLRVVVLNHNQIKRLENLKNLRKLEVLSVIGNQLEEMTVFGTALEPLLELKELNLSKNKIQIIKTSLSLFPNVEEIDLSGNPLNYVCTDAFANCPKLSILNMDNVKFRNPNSDLGFLASAPALTVTNSHAQYLLQRLSLNRSVNDMQSLEGMVDLPELEDLSLQGNGIISIVGIDEKFPNLTVHVN